jgi:hypothetical protein
VAIISVVSFTRYSSSLDDDHLAKQACAGYARGLHTLLRSRRIRLFKQISPRFSRLTLDVGADVAISEWQRNASFIEREEDRCLLMP